MDAHQRLSATKFRKSSYSANGGSCVEVGFGADVVGVRDTKDRDGGLLGVSPARWGDFVAAVKRDAYRR